MSYATLAAAADARAARLAEALGRRQGGEGDESIEPPARAAPAIPTAVHLVYESSGGDTSERVVTLLSAWETDGAVYFSGRCHLRQAQRTFRADRVVELVCLATGEAPDDPQAWLREHGLFAGERESDYTPHALRLCRDELAVLAYVAKADGHLDPDELEVALDHLMMSTERDIDRDRAARYLKRLSPSAADMPAHLAAIARRLNRWDPLMRSIRRLVDADHDLHIAEQIAVAELGEAWSAALDAEGKRREARARAEVMETVALFRDEMGIRITAAEIEAMVADEVAAGVRRDLAR